MTRRRDPIEQRREQIEREIAKLQNPKKIKKRTDFRSDDGFEKWQFNRTETLRELYEELGIIEYPSEYSDVPLAVAAAELGLTLDEISELIRERLVSLSSTGVSGAADRVSREELGAAIEIGASELLRQARLEIPELFDDAIAALNQRDMEQAQKIYERIEKHDSCINPYALGCEIGIQFVSENVTELESSFQFILRRMYDDPLPAIHAARKMLANLHSDSNILEVMRERFLAIADGRRETPFEDTFSRHQTTRFQSQMSDEQNLAIFIGDVVWDAVTRYKLAKSFTSSRRYVTEDREDEVLRVIQNAAYTALEAHKSYNESALSKIFVDRYVGVKTKRRPEPQLLELIPYQSGNK